MGGLFFWLKRAFDSADKSISKVRLMKGRSGDGSVYIVCLLSLALGFAMSYHYKKQLPSIIEVPSGSALFTSGYTVEVRGCKM